jgi:hypothetical protein
VIRKRSAFVARGLVVGVNANLGKNVGPGCLWFKSASLLSRCPFDFGPLKLLKWWQWHDAQFDANQPTDVQPVFRHNGRSVK